MLFTLSEGTQPPWPEILNNPNLHYGALMIAAMLIAAVTLILILLLMQLPKALRYVGDKNEAAHEQWQTTLKGIHEDNKLVHQQHRDERREWGNMMVNEFKGVRVDVNDLRDGVRQDIGGLREDILDVLKAASAHAVKKGTTDASGN